MPRPDEKNKIEFTKFIIFWNWEYAMRNDKHINDYNKILNGESINTTNSETLPNNKSKRGVIQGLPSSKFRRQIGELEYSLAQTELWRQASDGRATCSFYQGAEHILNFIINKKFIYRTPRCFMHKKPIKRILSFGGIEKLPVLDEIPEQHKRKILKYISSMREKKQDIIYIDFSANINTIVESIKLHYDILHESKSLTSLIDYRYEQAKTATSLSKLPKNEDKNLPRAVGLWMWDYIKEKQIQWKNRGRAITAYNEKYNNAKNKDLYINKYMDRAQLEKLLAATNRCIQEMKVLPLA